jgi:hypothetical protein
MRQMPEPIVPPNSPMLLCVVLLLGMFAAVAWIFYRRYTGLSGGLSALLCLLAAGLAVGLVCFVGTMPSNSGMRPVFGELIDAALLSFLAVPFVILLYRKWIGGHLTEAEKLPGMDGVRAWLGLGNIICASLIPICVWQVFGYSPIGFWALTFGALLAYPLLNVASDSAQPAPAAPAEDLSSEREKVLQLLEAGKINADESAELLNALGQSVPSRPQPASEMEITTARKIVLLGAALLLLGFFLPWFAIKPGEIIGEMANQFAQGMGGINLPDGTMKIRAGDLAHGLGWWILALGIGTAVLPFFATNLKAQTQKKVILIALAVGVFLIFYLLSDTTLHYIQIGLILALAGYALEIVGTLKERPLAR